VRETVPHYLVMQSAQVRIPKTISATHLAKVTKMALLVHKTIIFQNNTKVYLVRYNRIKTNKDSMRIAPGTIPLRIQTQIKVAK
jgi:hypothetical protein